MKPIPLFTLYIRSEGAAEGRVHYVVADTYEQIGAYIEQHGAPGKAEGGRAVLAVEIRRIGPALDIAQRQAQPVDLRAGE